MRTLDGHPGQTNIARGFPPLEGKPRAIVSLPKRQAYWVLVVVLAPPGPVVVSLTVLCTTVL